MLTKPIYIFVIGIPAAGKSTICAEIMHTLYGFGYSTCYISDGQVTEDLISNDVDRKVHTVEGGVIVFGEDTRRLISSLLSDRIRNTRQFDYVIVEIAVHSNESLLNPVASADKGKKVLIVIKSTLNDCLKRNRERALAHPDQFNSYVPESFTHKCFDALTEARLAGGSFDSVHYIKNSEVELPDLISTVRVVALNIARSHASVCDANIRLLDDSNICEQ